MDATVDAVSDLVVYNAVVSVVSDYVVVSDATDSDNDCYF